MATPEPSVPDWQWRPAAEIEWVASFCRKPREQILIVATRDGHVHTIDTGTGKCRQPQAIPAKPGVRLALCAQSRTLREPNAATVATRPTSQSADAHSDAHTYAFDLRAVYGFDIAEEGRLRWRAELEETQSADVLPGDPEYMLRNIAALDTDRGVLVVRSDGQLALLSASNGQPVWIDQLPPLTNARLHAHGETAAIVWKEQARVRLVFLDLPSGQRVSPVVHMPLWPLWSALTREGLVAVHADCITIHVSDAPVRACTAPRHTNLMASAVSLCDPASSNDTAQPRCLVIVGATDGRLHALAITSGVWLWHSGPICQPDAAWHALRCDADTVAAVTSRSAVLCDRRTGATLDRINAAPRERMLDIASVHGTTWHLAQTDSSDHGAFRLASAAANMRFESNGAFLRVFWTPDCVIIATQTEVQAFELPTP